MRLRSNGLASARRPVRRGALRHLRLRLPGLGRVWISQRLAEGRGATGRRDARPWIIFSPGALTHPGDYPELLDALTAAGLVVLTLDYDWAAVFAASAAETSKAARAVTRLLRGQLPARGLARHRLPRPPSRKPRRGAPPLRVLGYSLGAHVLSAAFQHRTGGRPLEIVLFGASTLQEPWRPPASRLVSVRFLAGTEDGVIDPAALRQLALAFGTDVEWLPGVNHFGVLDARVGAPRYRARDRATKLSRRQCAERIALGCRPGRARAGKAG